MIDFIERLLNRWFKSSPKDTYLKWLEQFDTTDATITTLPMMLVEFWNRVDLAHFTNGPTYKDMMNVKIHVRHSTIAQLESILMLATGAIAQDDEPAIHEISVNQFATFETMSMDDYFAGLTGGSIPYYTGVSRLKEAMARHGEVIEHNTSSYHCRMLNRMYNDILSVTVTMIQQMKDV